MGLSTKSQSLRVAAIQLAPQLGDVAANLESARMWVRKAFAAGAQWVVLPEFFTTGMTFADCMLDGVRPLDGEPMQLLKSLAAENAGTVGGSFLAESNGHVYNTFVLALADGTVFTHDKDFPTGPFEHAYYVGGEDAHFVSMINDLGVPVAGDPIPPRLENNVDGVFTVDAQNVGVAICWETIRQRTVKRLHNRIDFVLASSAWGYAEPQVGYPGLTYEQLLYLRTIMTQMLCNAPVQLAQMLRVPVVHANCVGLQRSTKLFDQMIPFAMNFAGESQIVDANGTVLIRRPATAGEGFITADIDINPKQFAIPHNRSDETKAAGNQFWIPNFPATLHQWWVRQGAVGRTYYLNKRWTKEQHNG